MTLQEFTPYFAPLAFAGYMGWRTYKFKKIKTRIPTLISEGAVIIDVRTTAEYASGAPLRSINIPLDQLNTKISKLDKSKPIILCCASGARSGMAASLLKRNGFSNVVNAGPWRNVP